MNDAGKPAVLPSAVANGKSRCGDAVCIWVLVIFSVGLAPASSARCHASEDKYRQIHGFLLDTVQTSTNLGF